MITTIFYILSIITIVTAILTVVLRNPIHSAISMIVCFFSISGHMMLLNAQFLAIINIIVYTGAVMVLILFTLMLMNLSKQHEQRKKLVSRIAATISACLLLVLLLAAVVKATPAIQQVGSQVADYQSVKVIGQVLFSTYSFPFEFISVLLIASMVGAVLVSKKEKNS